MMQSISPLGKSQQKCHSNDERGGRLSNKNRVPRLRPEDNEQVLPARINELATPGYRRAWCNAGSFTFSGQRSPPAEQLGIARPATLSCSASPSAQLLLFCGHGGITLSPALTSYLATRRMAEDKSFVTPDPAGNVLASGSSSLT
ncbi:hypothetical protein ABVK50_31835 (plasmid) [Mesorhizobium sp. WSM2240]|uniref:Uncharacterized protein n=1 Tax=Mesorhizobium sp. WSM2240 TaxID=3228851 RepID=A0AAU8CYT4_9HYPH